MAWGNSELLRFKIKKIRFFFITWKYQLNLISSILNLSSKKYPTIIPTLLLYFLSTSNIYLSGSADCSYRGVPSPVLPPKTVGTSSPLKKREGSRSVEVSTGWLESLLVATINCLILPEIEIRYE